MKSRKRRSIAMVFLAGFLLLVVVAGTVAVLLGVLVWNRNVKVQLDGDKVIELRKRALDHPRRSE